MVGFVYAVAERKLAELSVIQLKADDRVVPVVMFHSVGAENSDWVFSYISEPLIAFEDKVRVLAERGFSFITWSELYDYMRGAASLPLPAILLTFDDGYLDNWVYVYPILKKYGARGTIFVSGDFVDASGELRPTMLDVESGRCRKEDLEISGFLNWNEMREMERSGIIDIQSHAQTHTWYFRSDVLVDFWHPDVRDYPWMAWNARPDRKPYYMRENQSSLVRLGTPVYQYDKALAVTRCFPAEEICEGLVEYVEHNGGSHFFNEAAWRERLTAKHEELSARAKDRCRYESIDERRRRTRDELVNSKAEIEEKLAKRVDFICWPGGAYDQLTLEEARATGYKAWTLGSSDQSSFRNVPGADCRQVKRIGSAIRQSWRGRDLGYTSGREFYSGVRRHQGSVYHKWMGRAAKAVRIARSIVGY